MTEIIPTYEELTKNGKFDFLQKIEEKTIDGVINYIENPNTGGEFIIYNKDDINKSNQLGKIYLYQGKLYIVDDNKNITLLPTNTFEDLDKLKETYNIYYIDKEKPNESQQVYIEDENNIQTDKGVVLSFNKKTNYFFDDTLYLNTIYNGKFNQNNGFFTGYINSFHNNGNISYCSNLKNNNLDGYCIAYRNDGTILFSGVFKNNCFVGKDNKEYNPLTIQYGEFKNSCLYSGSGYLREDPTGKTVEELNAEQINPNNKIYTLERDKENPNIKTITYYGKALGLDENIELQININENNIATFSIIQNGKAITNKEEIENITNKIKKFFNSIPVEQLKHFDSNLSILYYFVMRNKINDNKDCENINILIPDICEYDYKKDKELEQTLNLINQIPQDERKGKYIIPCGWLKNGHKVNIIIDFDNKIFEIINTGVHINQKVINDLQKELRNNFKEENWIVYENHIIQQSTGNCVIASNIVATEKVMLEKQVKEYNEKEEELIKTMCKINELYFVKHIKELFGDCEELTDITDKEINDLKQQKETLQLKIEGLLNKIINSEHKKTRLKFNKEIKYFFSTYSNKIKQIVINEILYNDLINEVNELKKEKEGQINKDELLKEVLQKQSVKNFKQDKKRLKIYIENFIRYNLLLKERLFNEFNNNFSENNNYCNNLLLQHLIADEIVIGI